MNAVYCVLKFALTHVDTQVHCWYRSSWVAQVMVVSVLNDCNGGALVVLRIMRSHISRADTKPVASEESVGAELVAEEERLANRDTADYDALRAKLGKMGKKQLQLRLKMRGLNTCGVKKDLVDRLAGYEALSTCLEVSFRRACSGSAGATSPVDVDPEMRPSITRFMITAAKRNRAVFVSGTFNVDIYFMQSSIFYP